MALPALGRRVITLGVPLVLGFMELGHPALMPADDIVLASAWVELGRSRPAGA
jgi:hypothetical protein